MPGSIASSRTLPSPPRLDTPWLQRVRRSGWQGCTLFAGGEDVLDQTLLFWEEGKGPQRTLNLSLRVRRDCDATVLARLHGNPTLEVHEQAIPYPRKQVVAGEVHPLDREWSLVAGGALDASWPGPVRVRYFPYLPAVAASDQVPFATQGSLTLVLEGAAGRIDEAERLLEVLGSLGVCTTLSSADDLEYLYLRKIAWACHLDETAGPTSDAPLGERSAWLVSELSRHLGVTDVTREARYDPRPHHSSAYNPWARAVGSGEAGGPHWYRFDMEPALRGPLARTWLGHDLAAQAPDLGNRIARIIRTTGYLLSAEERWLRLGTPSQSVFGPSGKVGGGTHVPMHLLSDPAQATLVFSHKLLRRADHVAVRSEDDARALTPALLASRLRLEHATAYEPCEVFFKRSVSLVDMLVRINVDHESDRARILEAFGHVGITRLKAGPVDELVKVRG